MKPVFYILIGLVAGLVIAPAFLIAVFYFFLQPVDQSSRFAIHLPNAAEAVVTDRIVSIELRNDGQIQYDQSSITLSELQLKLRGFNPLTQQPAFVIHAHKDVPYPFLKEVLDAFASAEIRNVSLKPETSGP